MRQFIKVSNELNEELQRVFKLSRMSIWKALAFVTRHPKATEIREYALAHGGQYTEEDFTPNCNIRFENGMIYQDFPGKVKLIINTRDSSVSLTVNAVLEQEFKNVDMRAWGNIAALAQDRAAREVRL